MPVTKPARPRRYESPAGLVVHMNANGSLRRMEHGDIVLNLFPGTEMKGGPANVYLPRLGANVAWTPLLGPCSPILGEIPGQGILGRAATKCPAISFLPRNQRSNAVSGAAR